MPYAFRAATTQGNASGGAIAVSKPAGTVDGELIIIAANLEDDLNTWSSVGAGFTALRRDVNAPLMSLQLWWKRASGEPASWTWTPAATGWRSVVALTYSNNTGTGNQVDVDGTAQILDADTSPDAPSIVTTVANDLLLAVHNNYQGAAATETGAATTERADFGGVVISDALSVAAGATGVTTFSAGTVDHITRHLAMLLDSGGAAAGGLVLPHWRRRPTIQRMLRAGSGPAQVRRI